MDQKEGMPPSDFYIAPPLLSRTQEHITKETTHAHTLHQEENQ